MTFKDYAYERPNLDQVKQQYMSGIERIQTAKTAQDALTAIDEIQTLQNKLSTLMNLAYIRQSINTKDSYYVTEIEFWDENSPVMTEWDTAYHKAVLASAFKEELAKVLPEPFFLLAEQAQKTFDAKIIPLLQKENKLTTEYQRLLASAEIDYKGQTYNLSGLSAFMESADRQERKEVAKLSAGFFEENAVAFDTLYDELVKVRHEMAQMLGFKDFVEMGYLRMNRLDYTRQDVAVYRQNVKDVIVPLVSKLYERQAERIGLDKLYHYDLNFQYASGNAKPIGTPEDILANGVTMYHEMSRETGEFIDFMVKNELLDLVTKPAKAGGGYCTYIPDYQSPFIFSNFNGTSADIDVLTHEAGHAFQVYQSSWIKAPECIWPTSESCEIHSMSMEFLAWPWMKQFFGEQVDKYKFSHLSAGLKFLPYGVLVDHFQHVVYEHPEMTPAQRHQAWKELEQEYMPWKDYDDVIFLAEGRFWQRQAHIYEMPFYYIDYTLAQICAFQFWKRANIDNDARTWDDYMAICRVGGTKSFLQIVELANLQSPFKDGSLAEVAQAIYDYLVAIPDDKLQ